MARRQFEAVFPTEFKKTTARTLPPRVLSARPSLLRKPRPSVLGKLGDMNWRNAAVRRTLTGGAQLSGTGQAQQSGTPVLAAARPPCTQTPEKVLQSLLLVHL